MKRWGKGQESGEKTVERRRQDIGRGAREKGRKAAVKPRKGSGAGITVPRCGIQ